MHMELMQLLVDVDGEKKKANEEEGDEPVHVLWNLDRVGRG